MVRWFLAALFLVAAHPAYAFQTAGSSKSKRTASGPQPQLPGAVTRMPDGVAAGAPFDLPAFFTAPAPELNAAPLYLDALFELVPGMAICFREGAETARRKEAATARGKMFMPVFGDFSKNPASFNASAADRVISETEVVMRKLKEAQKRPKCVFQTGFDDDLPHAQATREVARLIEVRARRSIDRGNLDQPLEDFDVLLRLARDVRLRGPNHVPTYRNCNHAGQFRIRRTAAAREPAA